MTNILQGKVAIVTGSGANIGESCARTLAKAGASVVLADINAEGAQTVAADINREGGTRSEEHTSELQSLMRISYAVFCLKKKKDQKTNTQQYNTVRLTT